MAGWYLAAGPWNFSWQQNFGFLGAELKPKNKVFPAAKKKVPRLMAAGQPLAWAPFPLFSQQKIKEKSGERGALARGFAGRQLSFLCKGWNPRLGH